MTFRTPDQKSSGKAILITDGQQPDYSIHQLEGVVGTLLKEQQDLKNKIIEQEKRLHNLSKKNPGDKTQKLGPLKLKKQILHASRANIFNSKESLTKRDGTNKPSPPPTLK